MHLAFCGARCLKFLRIYAIVNVSRRVSSIPGHRRRRALYPPRRGRYAKGEMQRRNFVGLFRPVLVVESLSLSLILSPSLFLFLIAKASFLSLGLSPPALSRSFPFRLSRSTSISLVRSALWANWLFLINQLARQLRRKSFKTLPDSNSPLVLMRRPAETSLCVHPRLSFPLDSCELSPPPRRPLRRRCRHHRQRSQLSRIIFLFRIVGAFTSR